MWEGRRLSAGDFFGQWTYVWQIPRGIPKHVQYILRVLQKQDKRSPRVRVPRAFRN
jgi:hypothetical protein